MRISKVNVNLKSGAEIAAKSINCNQIHKSIPYACPKYVNSMSWLRMGRNVLQLSHNQSTHFVSPGVKNFGLQKAVFVIKIGDFSLSERYSEIKA